MNHMIFAGLPESTQDLIVENQKRQRIRKPIKHPKNEKVCSASATSIHWSESTPSTSEKR